MNFFARRLKLPLSLALSSSLALCANGAPMNGGLLGSGAGRVPTGVFAPPSQAWNSLDLLFRKVELGVGWGPVGLKSRVFPLFNNAPAEQLPNIVKSLGYTLAAVYESPEQVPSVATRASEAMVRGLNRLTEALRELTDPAELDAVLPAMEPVVETFRQYSKGQGLEAMEAKAAFYYAYEQARERRAAYAAQEAEAMVGRVHEELDRQSGPQQP